jgi:hypothetical protein
MVTCISEAIVAVSVESEVMVNKTMRFECCKTQRIVELRFYLCCVSVLKKLKEKICFLSESYLNCYRVVYCSSYRGIAEKGKCKCHALIVSPGCTD